MTLPKILLVIAAVLFVLAALAVGGVIVGVTPWAWAFGALAAWALSGAVP